MIGVLQQTQPPAVLPETFFILREAPGRGVSEKHPGDLRGN